MFLKDFLQTSEEHFFVGFRVDFYVFTDRSNEVPKVNMAAGRMVNGSCNQTQPLGGFFVF